MTEFSAKQMMIQFDLASGADRARAEETLPLCKTRWVPVTKSRFSHRWTISKIKNQNQINNPDPELQASLPALAATEGRGSKQGHKHNTITNKLFQMFQTDYERLRHAMVKNQIEARGITDPNVLDAMRRVERHQFVPPDLVSQAYSDTPLPVGEGQTISQPYIVALMSQLAGIERDFKVLEVGTGCGYQTAILSLLAREVYSIEIREALGNETKRRLAMLGYSNVRIRIGDGYQGWPEAAPLDCIVVTAAPDHIPQPLVEQLKTGGRMVIPVGDYYQELEVITKTNSGIQREKVIPVRFVPMTGEAEGRN